MQNIVLPNTFRPQHYSSFQRQLNYFSFKKLTTRDHPEFYHLISRVKEKTEDQTASSSPTPTSAAAAAVALVPVPRRPPSSFLLEIIRPGDDQDQFYFEPLFLETQMLFALQSSNTTTEEFIRCL